MPPPLFNCWRHRRHKNTMFYSVLFASDIHVFTVLSCLNLLYIWHNCRLIYLLRHVSTVIHSVTHSHRVLLCEAGEARMHKALGSCGPSLSVLLNLTNSLMCLTGPLFSAQPGIVQSLVLQCAGVPSDRRGADLLVVLSQGSCAPRYSDSVAANFLSLLRLRHPQATQN